ncbi:MAG: hypothetical protein WB565_14450 [Acidimicrobiales bacterium]
MAAVAAGGSVVLTVDGHGGIPASGVSAVVLNVTVTHPSAPGYITVYPDGTARPTVSNLNFSAGETVPNLVVAQVGADGEVDVFNGSGGKVQLVADASGWFASGPPTAGGLASLAPIRVLDTRNGTGVTTGPVASGQTVQLDIVGAGGVPASGVSAVVLNVTVTQPATAGYVTVYPDGLSRPTTSNLNFSPGETVPNLVVVPIGADGKVDFYNGSGGKVQFVADVSGWFAADTVTPLSGVVSLASDGEGYCAVLTSGGVDCWGSNDQGQLGDGTTGGNSDLPVVVTGVGGSGNLSGVTRLASDAVHGYCAVVTSGAVDCWGYGADGELGDGSMTASDVPVAVVGPGGVGALSGVATLVGRQQITGGSYCAIVASGGVDCWGDNNSGELGDATETNSDVPVTVVGVDDTGTLSGATSMAATFGSYCAVVAGGAVDCWGDNTYGELGNRSTTTSFSPVAVVGVGGSGALSGVATLSSSVSNYCAVMTSAGVDCWGSNANGDLGDGSTSGPESCLGGSLGCSTAPVAVVGVGDSGTLSGVSALSANEDSYCSVLSSGGMDCWGDNDFGQLGTESVLVSPSPVEVSGVGGTGTLGGVTGVVSSEEDFDVCAQLSGGDVACWGPNLLDPRTWSFIPVAVPGVGGSGVLGTVARLYADNAGICALLSTGGVDCWGDNSLGQLGNGTITSSLIPVVVDQIG